VTRIIKSTTLVELLRFNMQFVPGDWLDSKWLPAFVRSWRLWGGGCCCLCLVARAVGD